MEEAFSLFSRREDMNLGRILSRVLPAQTLDLAHDCQKSLFEGCDAACGTGHLGVEPQLAKERLDPEKETGTYQTQGLPRKINDKSLRLRLSRCWVTWAVRT